MTQIALLAAALFTIFPTSVASLPAPVEYRELNTSSKYNLIDPLLVVETDQRLYPEFNQIDTDIGTYIDNAKRNHSIESASVYIRDENSGHWSGVNEEEKFEPSSMLKVAVMIAYLRNAIDQAAVSSSSVQIELAKTIYYPGSNESGQYYPADTHLFPGIYSYQDLIQDMIINSDNVAAQMLINNNPVDFESVYNDFRLPASPEDVTDYMTAKSYSVLFRALYNSTYLPRRWSQYALDILTRTTFNKGIVAGVPKDLTVAHKFGEHTYIYNDGSVQSHQLHDCGIVYYPGKPYLICVMTRGQDFPSLEKTIANISTMTYNYFDAAAKAAKQIP